VTALTRARIIPSATPVTQAEPLATLSPATHRRVAREVVAARDHAEKIVAEARACADALLAEARAAAEGVARAAAAEARAEEEAKLAALYLAMKEQEERRAEADLDRAIALAVLLSERLLGEELERDPQRVVGLARQALSEARGARRAVIDASPLDAEALQQHLVDVGFGPTAVEIRADAALTRGSLRLSTPLGNLDAQLRPQLERLARALRDTLRGA